MRLLTFLSALFWSFAPTATLPGFPHVERLSSVGFTVEDMDRSVDFFEDVLSFELVSDVEIAGADYERLEGVFGARARVVRMRLGEEILELTEYLAPRGRSFPADSRSNDRWFQHVAIIVSDMDEAYARLRAHDVEHASTGPQTLPDWNPAAGGIRAFYFRDPDGHFLEILWFPPGKGDPRWHQPTNALFLGIDHTAIVVDDTDESLAFYRDVLGMEQVGESENYGIEQERLNQVFGARLRITALRAADGPGVEFLEYLAPGSGRAYPADARANDLLHWQTDFTVPDLGAVWRGWGNTAGQLVSPGPVMLESWDEYTAGMTVRDPDGHAVRLLEER